MRKLIAFLTLVPLLLRAADPVTPIFNGKLITPLDANSQPITNLGPMDLSGATNLPMSSLQQNGANTNDVATWDGSEWHPSPSAAGISASTATNIAAYQATAATNALGSAAFQPTTAFDPFNAAYHATNSLGTAAFVPTSVLTNGLPRGVTATGVATATTNAGGVVNIAVSPGGAAPTGVATNEYWVSTVPGLTGSGTTREDPMDASTTAKFDAVMNQLRLTNNARTIYVMEGKYKTTGQYGGAGSAWPLLSHTRILGDGWGRTIIGIEPGSNRTNCTILGTAFEQNNTTHGGKVTNVEIAGITFDGSMTNAGVVSDRVHGVALVGKDCWIHDCEFINFAGMAEANAESYCAAISGMEQHLETNILENANAVIERCIFRDFLGSYGNGPCVFECDGFRISDNVIIQPIRTNSEVWHPTMHGINVAGTKNGLINNNWVYGSSDGIYSDGEWAGWLGNTNILAINNHFTEVAIGWQISPYHTPPYVAPNTGWRFIGNDVHLTRYGNCNTCPIPFTMRGFQLYGPVYDSEVAFCRFTGPDEYGTNWFSGYVGGDPSPGAIRLHHNTWGDGVTFGGGCWGIGIESSVTNLQCEANYTVSGKLADNFDQGFRQTNLMHSASVRGGIIDMLPFFSASAGPWTNTTGLKFWNSNDCALYIMGTNGARAQIYPAVDTGGGITASTATNISAYQAQLATNGMTSAQINSLFSNGILTNNHVLTATFSNSLFSGATSALSGPANNEFPTAGWVRGLFNRGAPYYTSTNLAAFGTNFAYQSTIPTGKDARSYVSGAQLAPGSYLGSIMTTNTFQQMSGGIVVNAYLGFVGGGGTPTLTMHPEIYYSYDGTNWLGDYSAGPENIVNGVTNLYQWVVDFPLTSSTNANGFYIQRRFKCDTLGGNSTRTLWVLVGTNELSGTSDAAHTTMPSPTASAGNAFLAANQTFTGNNTFSSPVVASGGVTGNASSATTATTATYVTGSGGSLTNNTTGNATTATTASYVSTSPLTNNVSGNATTATTSTYVTTSPLTNNVSGNATTATTSTYVTTSPLTNNVSGNATTATTATTSTYVTGSGGSLTNNTSGNATTATTATYVTGSGGSVTNNTTGNAATATTASYLTQNPTTNNPVTLVTSWGGTSNTLTLTAYPQFFNVDATDNFGITNITGTLAGQYRSAIFLVSNSLNTTIGAFVTDATWRLVGPANSTSAATNGLQIGPGKVGVVSVGASGTQSVIWSDSVQP